MSTAEFLFYGALAVAYTSVALGLAVLITEYVRRQDREHHHQEHRQGQPPLQQ
jgi:hypothetical protein